MEKITVLTMLLLLLGGCALEQKTEIETNSQLDTEALQQEETSRSSQAAEEKEESDYPPLVQLDKQKVTAYLGANLNQYVESSPSVLGGSFYLTNIEWYTENTAIVTYEDGNKTVKARLTATVDGSDVNIVLFEEFSVE